MEEIWRKTSELLALRPILWVPVLLADLLCFLVSLSGSALVQKLVLGSLQSHSVLGGPAVHAPLSPGAIRHANLLAASVTLPFDFIRLLLYATAFLLTAALALAFVRREAKPLASLGPALATHAGSLVSLSLRALALYGAMVFLNGWLSQALVAHGHRAAVLSAWPEFGMGVLRVGLLSWLLTPLAVAALAGQQPEGERRKTVQVTAFALGILALILGKFVTSNIRSVNITTLPARYLLELTGSWIVALPYVVLFVCLAFAAHKMLRDPERPPV